MILKLVPTKGVPYCNDYLDGQVASQIEQSSDTDVQKSNQDLKHLKQQ